MHDGIGLSHIPLGSLFGKLSDLVLIMARSQILWTTTCTYKYSINTNKLTFTWRTLALIEMIQCLPLRSIQVQTEPSFLSAFGYVVGETEGATRQVALGTRMRLSKVSWFVSDSQINCLPQPLASHWQITIFFENRVRSVVRQVFFSYLN